MLSAAALALARGFLLGVACNRMLWTL